MRALVQRVASARVTVAGDVVGSIGKGALVLVGIGRADTEPVVRQMADKLVHLRMFEDEAGKTNLAATDIGAEVLVVSQFTLYADTRRGRRPGFTDAALPELAEPMVVLFAAEIARHGLHVETGRFGAHMVVALENDGPFTLLLEL